ncbi:hypothetical protein SDC9_180694 [bioreactor metagenome]|uniref:Uncharacterized protein n=1 Tax=bioreactor metagenome TaxID=1076179 RepID=A0A645H3D7_9ZZZZ
MGFFRTLLRHFPETFFAHCGHVDGGHKGVEALVGADVGGRLVSAYMLLSCLESQYKGSLSIHVVGLAYNPSGHFSHKLGGGGQEAEVRAAEAEAVAQGLAFAHRYVDP